MRERGAFRESAHAMRLIGYARVATVEGRQVVDRTLDAPNAASS